jgi:hypothetical protein
VGKEGFCACVSNGSVQTSKTQQIFVPRLFIAPPTFAPRKNSFDNRKNPYLFRDTMLRLIHSDNLEYKELTKAA